VGVNPDIRRRHDAIREAAALLGEGSATLPPADLRARILRTAATMRRSGEVTPSSPVDVYAHQIAELRDVLDMLADEDWRAVAKPYTWTVHGLVAHLLVSERYTARQLGLAPDLPYGDADHHLAIGAEEIAAELVRSPRETMEAWHDRALETLGALRSGAIDLAAGVTFHGWPFSGNATLIARGFELWTHADDIRRATGRPLSTPTPADLRAMSTFSVGSLPLLLPVIAPDVPVASARIVLTGAGGGTFRIGGDGAEAAVTIVTDLVDYCRLASRRIEPSELAATIEGDERLASSLLSAARVFAV
jgi:uncharacterized protein (TIGR03083 family)